MIDLEKLTDNVVEESGFVNLEEALEGYKILEEARKYMLATPYFRCLSAYCKINNIKRVLELGTCTGASAIALAQYSEKVDTYDVTDEDINSTLTHKNITSHILTNPLDCLEINLDPYDLIFIDIDHKGDTELKLHNKLSKEYKGIVFYDDIFFSSEMAEFWNKISQNKKSLLWHFTGFGIVEY